VFFLLVTEPDENDQLIKEYEDVVNRYLSQAYFYATNTSIIPETYFSNYKSDDVSQIFAIKNEEFYLYKPDVNNNSLEEFIIKEKVTTFPQIAAGNVYDLILTKKIILIYGFNDQQEVSSEIQKRLGLIDDTGYKFRLVKIFCSIKYSLCQVSQWYYFLDFVLIFHDRSL
jgi:hypothetical protein